MSGRILNHNVITPWLLGTHDSGTAAGVECSVRLVKLASLVGGQKLIFFCVSSQLTLLGYVGRYDVLLDSKLDSDT